MSESGDVDVRLRIHAGANVWRKIGVMMDRKIISKKLKWKVLD